MGKHTVYTFYAELSDYEPKIWRRFEINGEKTMAELSYAIMTMFEMRGQHLFNLIEHLREPFIEKMKKRYEDDGIEFDVKRYDCVKDNQYEFIYDEIHIYKNSRLCDPSGVSLNRSGKEINTKYTFNYDYGDGWEISMILESIRDEDISLSLLPRVLDGEGYGIIENIGGTSGLDYFTQKIQQDNSEEQDEFMEWIAVNFNSDLTHFDKNEINYRLKKLQRIYRNIYEYDVEITKSSLKLLYRE